MAAAVNERLADEVVHHAIDLDGYSNGVVRRLLAILNRADARLFAQLQEVLDGMDAGSFTVQRLDGLLQSVRALNADVYRQFESAVLADMLGLSGTEATYQGELMRSALPPQISVVSITQEQVYAAALSRPMQGRLLREWAASLEADRAARIRDTLRMGYLEGKTTDQLVREIRGTRAKGYSDGIIEIDRRNAQAVVRTAVSHTAATARDEFTRANLGLVKAVMWRSTLDSRTSAPCRLRDGKRYTADSHKPIDHQFPWGSGPGRLHWCCRSTFTNVLKSYKELGGADIESFTPSERASMDGAVPADTTYQQWLEKQSAKRQDEVLGKTRGKLLREGGLTLDRFSTDKGKWLTLEELAQRNADAFKRAGLN